VTGLRLGWLICPREAVAAAIRAHQLMTTSASTYGQRVAVELLADPHTAADQRALYQGRRQALMGALARTGLQGITPEGAFYCLVRWPRERWASSLELAYELVDHAGVAAIPGVAFGAACEPWLRITWVAEPSVVAEGLHRMAAYLSR
jgi:aspartate/methionine/tyrosine aminotransferase